MNTRIRISIHAKIKIKILTTVKMACEIVTVKMGESSAEDSAGGSGSKIKVLILMCGVTVYADPNYRVKRLNSL